MIYTKGRVLIIHFCTKETDKKFFFKEAYPHCYSKMCSTDSLIASFINSRTCSFLSHYLPTHWILDSETAFQAWELFVLNIASIFMTSVILSLLTEFLFRSVSCLSLQSSQVSVRFWEHFLILSIIIVLQKSSGVFCIPLRMNKTNWK